MTHAVHRRVPEKESDYVLMMRSSKGINQAGAGEKLLKFLERIEPLGPVNFGNPADGTLLRTERSMIKKNINDGSNLHIVFKDSESAQKAVEIAWDMNTGLSVSLTGPLDRIRGMAAEMGLRIDSFQIDLGTIGDAHLDDATEGILSLCGHMRVSENLIKEMRKKVKACKVELETASREIGKVCLCGCFNPHAAGKLLTVDDK
ncbi:MAG: hypothetical protein P1P89_07710 [Desulfobacterales bacterium]|nr:hypothetical protein [Desulfobacterales bacterium]